MFTKNVLLYSAIALTTVSVANAGDYRVGTRLHCYFTAVQGATVPMEAPDEAVGQFWMSEGHIYKAYRENGVVVVREILIDLVDNTKPRGIPAQVWCDGGELLVKDGRYTFKHKPVWHEQLVRGFVGTGRYVQAPAPVLPMLLPPTLVPEAVPVDHLRRLLVSEWEVVSVGAPVWLDGTIEPIDTPQPTLVLPRVRIDEIQPTPDPAFQNRPPYDEFPPLLVPPVQE